LANNSTINQTIVLALGDAWARRCDWGKNMWGG
jgi:hypothetical protein